MGYEASVLYRATKRLEEGRRRREEALARRKTEIYAQLPRVREIDKELKGTVYQIIASSLREGRDPRAHPTAPPERLGGRRPGRAARLPQVQRYRLGGRPDVYLPEKAVRRGTN